MAIHCGRTWNCPFIVERARDMTDYLAWWIEEGRKVAEVVESVLDPDIK